MSSEIKTDCLSSDYVESHSGIAYKIFSFIILYGDIIMVFSK